MSGQKIMTKNPAVEAQTFQQGTILNFTAPAGGKNGGDVIQVAGFAGVVTSRVEEGELGEAMVEGVFLCNNSGITPVAGDKVAFDDAAKNVVASGGGTFELGTVTIDVVDGTSPVAVRFNK